MNKQQSGFTLIELVVVIVILGILAATALPRFIDLTGAARQSVMRGVEGSMRAANAMIYAKAAAANQLGAVGVVTIPGVPAPGTVTLAFGYASNATELGRVMDLSPAGDFNNTGAAIQHLRAAAPGSCQIAYAAPGVAGAPPTYPPTLSEAGCT